MQSRIFPSCSVAETQPSSCKNAGEWFKGTGRTLAGEILVFLYGWVYFQGLVGGAEDYRGKRSGFAPAFRELCGPGLLGVTDKTADVESGTWACSQLSPAPLSPSTRRQDGPHKTRDLKGPFWSKNEFSRAVQELHNFSQCHKRTYRLRERERKQHSPLYGHWLTNAHMAVPLLGFLSSCHFIHPLSLPLLHMLQLASVLAYKPLNSFQGNPPPFLL